MQRAALKVIAAFFIIVAAKANALVSFERKAVERWANEYFTAALQKKRITGAAFGVVQNDEIVFLKGYGWQDIGREIPLDPDKTMFRACSNSKTYTATALMQLVERGQIASLDAPVNDYLERFTLPPPHGDTVTLRHLLTHSSGMTGASMTPQGIARDIAAPVDAKVLAKILHENLVRPPGELMVYSNLGVALQGALIEDVSGLSLAEYMRRELFEPLGMSSAVLHHTTKPPDNIGVPYGIFPNGALQEVTFYPKHPVTAASGGLILTPADMLKFITFHADDTGSVHPNVLSANTRRLMHTRQFAVHPAQAGIGLQFFSHRVAGERLSSHGCSLPGTTSFIGVFPDSRAGFAVFLLAADPTPTLSDVWHWVFGDGRLQKSDAGPQGKVINAYHAKNAFLKATLGKTQLLEIAPDVKQSAAAPAHQALAGNYWSEQRAKHSVTALINFVSTREVELEGEAEIRVDGKLYRRVNDGVYDAVKGRKRVIFTGSADGEIYMSAYAGARAHRKVSGLSDPVLVFPSFAIGLLFSLSGLGAIFWHRVDPTTRTIRRVALGLPALLLALPAVLFVNTDVLSSVLMDYYNNGTSRMAMSLVLLNTHLVLGFVLVIATGWAWTTRAWGDTWKARATRFHLTFLALACIATWPGFVLFNLVGLNLR